MKTLIIGTGIIGTIYGWALHKAGVDVTHLVRTPKPDLTTNGATIDILDERKGYKKYNQTTYPIHLIDHLDKTNKFDLVIVPTNWYQTATVLQEVVSQCPDSFFYILTSNWKGTDDFDKIIDRSRYILGYPDGGGTIKENTYWTNIGPEIHIAKPTQANQSGFEKIEAIFSKADITLDIQENMLHWLWVHNAGSVAISVAVQKYRNTEKYLRDKRLLKGSFIATRECLALCEKRGAYSKSYPEIAAFKMPLWLLIPLFKFNFRHNASMKRYTAHSESMPIDDVKCNYYDILETAKECDFAMPYYEKLETILK